MTAARPGSFAGWMLLPHDGGPYDGMTAWWHEGLTPFKYYRVMFDRAHTYQMFGNLDDGFVFKYLGVREVP